VATGGGESRDPVRHNREAWDSQAREGGRWSRPVTAGEVEEARRGRPRLLLTPNRPVPAGWLEELAGREVLCLASGGGQQAPLLAAAGARVTSFDNSPGQLARDEEVAQREGLVLRLEQGDMADLGRFGDWSFDLVFHPVSNVFAAAVRPVWRECHRVLREGGRLLAGFMNPAFFLFDHEALDRGEALEVRYRLPYSDLADLPAERLERLQRGRVAFEFSHSLEEQIGGQLEAGFRLEGLYEDDWDAESTRLQGVMPMFLATLARKG